MVAKRGTKYSEIGEVLSPETAFIQASCALDVAAFIAEENRDVETLVQIAQTYVGIAERLMPHSHDDDDDEDESKQPFGFFSEPLPVDVIDPELPEDEVEEEIEDDGPQD